MKTHCPTKNNFQNITIKYSIINSPFGCALVAETEIGICKLSYIEEDTLPEEILRDTFPKAKLVRELAKYGTLVKNYFSDWKIPEQKIVLDLKGTPFQLKMC